MNEYIFPSSNKNIFLSSIQSCHRWRSYRRIVFRNWLNAKSYSFLYIRSVDFIRDKYSLLRDGWPVSDEFKVINFEQMLS